MKQRLLTFREAAVALKWVDHGATEAEEEAAGRRLRYTIAMRERQTGKRIATRLGHRVEAGEPQQRVTLSAIFRHFPELRKDKPELLADEMRDYLDERLAERVAEEVDLLVGPQIKDVVRDVDHVANRARDQAAKVLKRVERLELDVAGLLAATNSKAPKASRDPEPSG